MTELAVAISIPSNSKDGGQSNVPIRCPSIFIRMGKMQMLKRRTTEKRNRIMCVPCLSAVNDEDLEHFILMITTTRITLVTKVVMNRRSPVNAYRKEKTKSVEFLETKFTKHQESG